MLTLNTLRNDHIGHNEHLEPEVRELDNGETAYFYTPQQMENYTARRASDSVLRRLAVYP